MEIATAAPSKSSTLNIFLWIAQALLALVFGLAGAMKLGVSEAELAKSGNTLPMALVRFIGIAEVAGALGMILPALTRIKPLLTPLAAIGLALIMVLASLLHLSRGEFAELPITVALGAMAIFVAWGRFKGAPTRGAGPS